jgi:hypothetical protein
MEGQLPPPHLPRRKLSRAAGRQGDFEQPGKQRCSLVGVDFHLPQGDFELGCLPEKSASGRRLPRALRWLLSASSRRVAQEDLPYVNRKAPPPCILL